MQPTISVIVMTSTKKLVIHRVNPASIIESVLVHKDQKVAEGDVLYTIVF